MSLTALDRTKLRTLAFVAVISAVGGALYGAVAVDPDGVSTARHPALVGAYVGGVIGLAIGGFEIFSTVVRALWWVRRSPFAVGVLLRSVFYLLVFVAAIESAFLVFGIAAEGWGWGDTLFLTTVAPVVLRQLPLQYDVARQPAAGARRARRFPDGPLPPAA